MYKQESIVLALHKNQFPTKSAILKIVLSCLPLHYNLLMQYLFRFVSVWMYNYYVGKQTFSKLVFSRLDVCNIFLKNEGEQGREIDVALNMD